MPLEIAQIRRRVQMRLADVKRVAAGRREQVAAAERAYMVFLPDVAVPTVSAVAQSLSAEGYPYRVTTPGGAVRMTSERSSRTYVEIRLDTTGPLPQIIAEIGRERGSRVLSDDQVIGEGLPVDEITDEHVLDVLVDAIGELL
ncbi:MAG: hypothetical protein NTY02_03310 [Acidobacteria bacterium]|nr:hypothetical protein [Acidobacteriota bacterium]